jgi:hypothetical protein
MKFLAASLLVLASQCSFANEITILGEVRLKDGSPIKLGTILIKVLKTRKSAMPTIVFRTETISGLDGKFEIKLPPITGIVDFSLVDDHCGWRSGYLQLTDDQLKGKKQVSVKIIAIADEACTQGDYL